MSTKKAILDLEKPQSIRGRRVWYRFFYNSNPNVGETVDNSSFLKISIGDISCPFGSSGLRSYIYDFFRKMCGRLNLGRFVVDISHEYFLMGNCTVFTEDGNLVKGSGRKNEFDRNPRYQGWERLLILPPDQVRVRKIPLLDEVVLSYLPDPVTLDFLKQKKSLFKFLKGKSEISLDQNPMTGSFAHFFARKTSQYDTLGISSIEKYMNLLANNKEATVIIPEGDREILRSKIKTFVEECLFKPVAIRKGFMGGPKGLEPRAIYPTVILK